MRKPRVILLGARGQLGTDFAAAAANHLDVFPVGRETLDVSIPGAADAFLEQNQFDVLVNCAAYNKTDEAEGNAQYAFRINAHSVHGLALICAAKNARFMHVSTDYVFGGAIEQKPIREHHARAPLNVYGASKAMGEDLAQIAHDDVVIVRTAALFGVAGSQGKGGNFVETMLSLARDGRELRVVDDQITSPTSTGDAATAMIALLTKRAPAGIYHVVNAGPASWWALARRALDLVGLKAPLEPIATARYPTRAMRPSYSALDCGKLTRATGLHMRSWESALSDYLKAKGYI